MEGKESCRRSYIGGDAATVQRVTGRLASWFIEENLRDRVNQAQDTNEFLDSQLQDSRRRLVEHEKKLEAYRHEYSGQLPSQAASNLQAIQNLQMQLQTLSEASDRATERRMLLERQLADLDGAPAVAASAVGPAEGDAGPGSTAAAGQRARRLRDLLTLPAGLPRRAGGQRGIRNSTQLAVESQERRRAANPATIAVAGW